MPQKLKLATAQPSTQRTLSQTLQSLTSIATRAASRGADILLLPEAYLGGYPRGCSFGASIGARSNSGREQFLAYWKECPDFGDTPRGDEAWTEWSALDRSALSTAIAPSTTSPSVSTNGNGNGNGTGTGSAAQTPPIHAARLRGDGTREALEALSARLSLFLVVGTIERSGGSLYCSALYIDPARGCIGKRRKVQPTGSERLVWAAGSPSTLKAVVATIRGVRVVMGAAICWENYMPLLRYALYAQNVNLWLAPTADARSGWEALMRVVASEGRCYVVSSCMCVRKGEEALWVKEGEESKGIESAREKRGSVVTRTQENHEITWPQQQQQQQQQKKTGGEAVSGGRRRSSVAYAVGPHELRLPCVEKESEEKSTPSSQKEDTTGSNAIGEEDEGPLSGPPAEWSCRGGSCIIGPQGDVLAGPLWEDPDGMLIEEVDFDDCIRGRLDFDAAGSYSRNDSFELKVAGLDLNPPA